MQILKHSNKLIGYTFFLEFQLSKPPESQEEHEGDKKQTEKGEVPAIMEIVGGVCRWKRLVRAVSVILKSTRLPSILFSDISTQLDLKCLALA